MYETADMVRCKGLVETTRVLVVEVMSREVEEGEDEDLGLGDSAVMDTDAEMGTDAESHGGTTWNGGEDEDDEHNMDVARVYEKTLTQLGEVLGDATEMNSDGK